MNEKLLRRLSLSSDIFFLKVQVFLTLFLEIIRYMFIQQNMADGSFCFLPNYEHLK